MSTRKRQSASSTREVSHPPLRRKLNSISTKTDSPESLNVSTTALQSQNQTTRIFSWNVNGIIPLLHLTPPITTFFTPTSSTSTTGTPSTTSANSPLHTFLQRHSFPEILCLQEVKISPTDSSTQKAVSRSANPSSSADKEPSSPRYTAHFSLPHDKHNAKAFSRKIYGVCTLNRSDFTDTYSATTRTVPWDLEGRILITELAGPRVAVVNGYWVNGTDAPYRNPVTGLVEGTRHEWKRRFHDLVRGEVRRFEEMGWGVVLIGDMNVARDERDGWPGIRKQEEHVMNRRDWERKFMEEGGMFDVWRELRGSERKYTYYPRGVEWGSSCDRVGMCVVSKGLLHGGDHESKSRVLSMEILDSVKARGSSDHVPIYVELNLQAEEEQSLKSRDDRLIDST